MLTREFVEEIVEMRIPDQQVLKRLEQLSMEEMSADTVRMFVDVVRGTLGRQVKELGTVHGTIDCSGTGGSGLQRFNTSTTVAFVLAAAGLKVAKFGNRAAQSNCGSFDLLEAIGISAALPPHAVPEVIEETGLVFLFAPQFYPALARLAPVRKAIGKRTVFNSIGPLLNPIVPEFRVMGVSDASAQPAIAEFLAADKSIRRSLVVRSSSGLDELEPGKTNVVYDAMQGYVNVAEVVPEPVCSGGDEDAQPDSFTVEDCRQLFFALLDGSAPNWLVNLVCVNAGAGLMATGCSHLETSARVALDLIKSGAVKRKFEECRRAYARFAP